MLRNDTFWALSINLGTGFIQFSTISIGLFLRSPRGEFHPSKVATFNHFSIGFEQFRSNPTLNQLESATFYRTRSNLDPRGGSKQHKCAAPGRAAGGTCGRRMPSKRGHSGHSAWLAGRLWRPAFHSRSTHMTPAGPIRLYESHETSRRRVE